MRPKKTDPEKWCTGPCGRLLPTEVFGVDCHGWIRGRCPDCRRLYSREKMRAYRKRMKARDKAIRAAKQKAYRDANVEVVLARARAWYAKPENKLHVKLYQRRRRLEKAKAKWAQLQALQASGARTS